MDRLDHVPLDDRDPDDDGDDTDLWGGDSDELAEEWEGIDQEIHVDVHLAPATDWLTLVGGASIGAFLTALFYSVFLVK